MSETEKIPFENIADSFKDARKIVIKIGSNTLAKADGTINTDFMNSFASQCCVLIEQGKQIVLVSSGAGVAGVSTINGWARRKDIHYRQALCAIGQVELMDKWRAAFRKGGLHVGQLLLTKDDFEDSNRTLHIRNTLFTLIDENVVPIINENDSTATEEFFIGDNDNLSALAAILWSADLLILYSDIDGVFSDNPKTNPAAELIKSVESIVDLRKNIKIGSTNSFGTGGIETKLQAAEKVSRYGIPMILTNGANAGELCRLSEGHIPGTLFLAASQ